MCWFFATDFFAEELGNLCLTKIQKVDDSNTQVCNNDTGLISVLLPVRCIPVLIYRVEVESCWLSIPVVTSRLSVYVS